MENTNMTLVAAVLVVGLLLGAGVGYYMAPSDSGNLYMDEGTITSTDLPSFIVITPDAIMYTQGKTFIYAGGEFVISFNGQHNIAPDVTYRITYKGSNVISIEVLQ